jgi:hypothetical protein
VVSWGFDTYSFEHLDLFYEENFQPLLCSNFDEGKDMFSQSKIFVMRVSSLPPFSPCYSTIDMVGGFSHDSHFPIGQSCFQPMVCCKGFQFHTQDQQTLGWEQVFFSLGLV